MQTITPQLCQTCHNPLPPRANGKPYAPHMRCASCRQQYYQRTKPKAADTAFVFVDGETQFTTYDYLGYIVYYPNGEFHPFSLDEPGHQFSLTEAVQFLYNIEYSIKQTHPEIKKVAFYAYSFGYDKEQLLKGQNLDDETLFLLSRQSSPSYGAVRGTNWVREVILPHVDKRGNPHEYAVYLGKKTWEFSKVRRAEDGSYTLYHTIRVHDCYTLQQGSFMTAVVPTVEHILTSLPACIQERAKQAIEDVRKGKEAREDFAEAKMDRAAIITYNDSEGILTGIYLQHITQMCEELDLYPRSLAGPAPLATAAWKKSGANKHTKPDFYDSVEFYEGHYKEYLEPAFFGGRIEMLGQGNVAHYYKYDIRSAYPFEQVKLPCLKHGHFTEYTGEEASDLFEQDTPWMIYHIRFHCDADTRIGPFAVRTTSKGVVFPLFGKSVYTHGRSLKMFEKYGKGGFTILDALRWTPECDCEHPWSYLGDYYELRKKLREEGNNAQGIVKLIINSSYGKLAQRNGMYEVRDNDGNLISFVSPATANLFGAGFVTDATRAYIYEAAMKQKPEVILGFATDCIYSTEPLEGLTIGKNLGEWDMEEHFNSCFIAPGMMSSADDKENRTRGVNPAAMKKRYGEIIAAWDNHQEELHVVDKKFYSASMLLLKNMYTGEISWHDKEKWCTFETYARVINIAPNAIQSKRVPTARADSNWQYMPPYPRVAEGRSRSQMLDNIASEYSSDTFQGEWYGQ